MKKSFTLIELMVVIAVISILAVMVTPHLGNILARARDSRRLGDMRNISIALEQFYSSNNRYPNLNDDGVSDQGEFVGDNNGPLEQALFPYFTAGRAPADPRHDGTNYYYGYDPYHCYDVPMGSCNCAMPWGRGAVLGFRRAETTTIELRKAICSGGDMHLDVADYNLLFLFTPPG